MVVLVGSLPGVFEVIRGPQLPLYLRPEEGCLFGVRFRPRWSLVFPPSPPLPPMHEMCAFRATHSLSESPPLEGMGKGVSESTCIQISAAGSMDEHLGVHEIVELDLMFWLCGVWHVRHPPRVTFSLTVRLSQWQGFDLCSTPGAHLQC